MRPAAPAAILALALLAGCSDPGSAVGFNEKDPAARFRATRQAAQTNDKDSIPALALLAGCSDPGSAVGFNEKDPAARFRATRQAAQTNDKDSIPALIQRLESDDPAERMLAIHTLNRLTGQTLGYDHAAPRDDRDVAIGRWADWYNQQQQPLPQKADK